VGPVFPRYFAMQAACGVLALVAALGCWGRGGVHRARVLVIAVALATVAAGWPISDEVSRLRLQRFNPDATAASAARAAFATWHLVILGLSFVTVRAAGVALALAGRLPGDGGRPTGPPL
ncbi:MAG: acyl-phosphate glycerol 3-phosphate acyltransferase, partial [Gemmata sp.]